MNDLQLMKSEKFGTIRKICEDGKVLYCGSDVAKALGYSNSRKALSDHCKGVTKRDTPTNSGIQQMSFIPESDVYRLICHSKLPSALEFEKWVFEDVVPNAISENLNPEPEQLTLETSEYHYFAKTLNGEPVITLADFEHFTGITSGSVRHALYNTGKDGEDYKLLTQSELAAFKTENPSITKAVNALVVIRKPGVDKLIKHFGCNAEIPQMIESKPRQVIEVLEITRYKQVTADDCVAALNVLQYIKNSSKKTRTECRESGDMKLFEEYDKDVAAVERTIRKIGLLLLSSGC